MLLITVDTNQLDVERINRVRDVTYLDHQIACVTVSTRERGETDELVASTVPEAAVWDESNWDEAVWGGRTIAESFILGESELGEAVLGSGEPADLFELALRTISNGSFPPPGAREQLTPDQRRQLRDAMIFEAHVRERRHVLITDDAKGFVRDGRREALEALGATRICTWAEYETMAAELRLDTLYDLR